MEIPLSKPRSIRLALFTPFVALASILSLQPAPLALAQDAPKGNRQKILPQISIIDKLLATEMALGPSLKRNGEEAWAATYEDLYQKFKRDANPGTIESRGRPVMALALGVKASDGVLALKGRDTEGLGDCADQIDKLARKLGVPAEVLQRASIVKRHADQKHWVEGFMELGYLQHSVMKTLERNPDQKDDALLIILGGWLQGGQCVTKLILDNYTKASSNILREPKLVDIMIDQANGIRDEYKKDPVVAEVLKLLPAIHDKVNVGLRDPIPQADVEFMNKEFGRLVDLIVKPAAK